jgi:hypothetical protein
LTVIFYSSLQLGLCCSLLFNLLLHYLGSLHDCSSPDHLLLHQAKALIFSVEVCQLFFNNYFNFFLRLLLGVFYGFDLLVWVLVWNSGVGDDHLLMSRWLSH